MAKQYDRQRRLETRHLDRQKEVEKKLTWWEQKGGRKGGKQVTRDTGWPKHVTTLKHGHVPDGTFKLTSVTNLRKKVTFMWYSNDMHHYMLKS